MAAYSSPDRSGVVWTANNGRPKWLSIESLSANVFIADLCARTVLSQDYYYTEQEVLYEAYYVFPIPPKAAVCSFDMVTSDGNRLHGRVKEIKEAREEYEKALRENRLTGILEQFNNDIFAISLGILSPNTKITVTISFVMDLADDDQANTVRFQLSSYVSHRYGAPSTSILHNLGGTVHRAALSITVDIEMSSEIAGVSSLHHNPVEDIIPASSSLTRKRVRYTSADVELGKDFVLIISAWDLEESACLSEQIEVRDGGRVSNSTALALSIVPTFETRTQMTREYLFLIDKSGSMAWTTEGNLTSRMDMAKQALKLLVQSIPVGAYFNICSFSDQNDLFRSQIQIYDGPTKAQAAASLEAGGGTELLTGLNYLLSNRKGDIPTSVFVLTDGGVSSPREVIEFAGHVVRNAPPRASVKICTLAVGSGASLDLCEGLASAGNGICLQTTDGEDLTRKANRLFEAMGTPEFTNISVDWNVPVHQAPANVIISPNQRTFLTAILPPSQGPPSSVTLRGQLSDGSQLVYDVPVRPIQVIRHSLVESVLDHRYAIRLPPLIHSLACHRLILDVERNLKPLIPDWYLLTPRTRDQLEENFIVEMGLRYQIASSRTAFIAIASPLPSQSNTQNNGTNTRNSRTSTNQNRHSRTRSSSPSTTFSTATSNSKGSNSSNSKSPSSTSTFHTADNGTPRQNRSTHRLPSRHTSTFSGDADSRNNMPGGFPSTQTSNQRLQEPTGPPTYHTQQAPLNTSDELLYVFGPNNESSIAVAPPLLQDTVVISFARALGSLFFPGRFRRSGNISQSQNNVQQPEDPQFRRVLDIVTRLQNFDGLYADLDGVLAELYIPFESVFWNPPPQAEGHSINSKAIWATAIVVAHLRKRFPAEAGIWNGLARKALQAGFQACGRDAFKEIVQQAYNKL
ncbi:hypothetical protein M422DRAFT_63949 [Sphaerobolus stellatus SS14]|nr:hypothetical protein M422DRAFT_63949 [Sphaerobolus stellatus SS14]